MSPGGRARLHGHGCAEGTLLVTSSTGLERLEDGVLVPHADLSHLSPYGWNEPAVHPSGHVYVNNINFDMMGADGMDLEKGSVAGLVAVVTPTGASRIVATEVAFPNGMAITADGSTLLVAESFASRIGAWDIGPDGGLSNRRVWAADVPADGISLDADGALWVASQDGAWRVREGGEVTDRVPTDRPVFSCALGGDDGRTLFLVCNEWHGPTTSAKAAPASSTPPASTSPPPETAHPPSSSPRWRQQASRSTAGRARSSPMHFAGR